MAIAPTTENVLLWIPKFVKTFPIGTTLTVEELDAFFESNGLIDPCHAKTTKGASWSRRILQRNDWRRRINHVCKSGYTDPTLAIQISVVTPGRAYEVVTLEDATVELANVMPYKIKRYFDNRRAELKSMINHCDRTKLPAHLKTDARGMLRDLNDWEMQVALQASQYNKRYGTFLEEIQNENAKLEDKRK